MSVERTNERRLRSTIQNNSYPPDQSNVPTATRPVYDRQNQSSPVVEVHRKKWFIALLMFFLMRPVFGIFAIIIISGIILASQNPYMMLGPAITAGAIITLFTGFVATVWPFLFFFWILSSIARGAAGKIKPNKEFIESIKGQNLESVKNVQDAIKLFADLKKQAADKSRPKTPRYSKDV